MSRRVEKSRSGIQSENKKLEQEIEELEDALLLHKHIHHNEEAGIRSVLRKETGGSRWEHGGQGKLRTYKSSRDLDERYGQVQLTSGTQQMRSDENVCKRRKEEHDDNGGEPKLVKVGSVDRIRSSARARRDRQHIEKAKSGNNQPLASGKLKREVTAAGPQKQSVTKDTKGNKRLQECASASDPVLFPTEPLMIENLKDRVLQKAGANIIKRSPPPNLVSKDLIGEALNDKQTSVVRAPASAEGGVKSAGSTNRLASGCKNDSKQQPNRRARESRHAAKATIEDYVNMVAGSSSLKQSSVKSTDRDMKSKDGKSELNQNKPQMDLIGRRAKVRDDDIRTAIDVVERFNTGPASHPATNKPFSREVLTSDYSSDLETSPDRSDEPQFGGASFDREAWLSAMKAEEQYKSKTGARPPAPSDDISDTPILGGIMVDFKSSNFDLKDVRVKPECDPGVVSWLENLCLRECSRYIDVFAENEIDMETLKDLTAEQLNQMGITAVGPVNKILRAVSALKQNSPVSSIKKDSAPDITVDELLAAVGSNLKKSPRNDSGKSDKKNLRFKRKMKNKNEFDFTDFAGEEGKDEIKKRLWEKNQMAETFEREDITPVVKGEENVSENSVQREEIKHKPVRQRKSSFESKRELKRTESMLEDSKQAEAKQKTLVRRRSSSGSRIQSDRERSLSSEGSIRGRQPSHPRPVQSVPKRLPSGKKTKPKDGSTDAGTNVMKSKPAVKNKSSEAIKKHAEAGISAAVQKKEEIQQKAKRDLLEQQQMEESRRKRRDKMAAKHTGRQRPDSRGSIQPSSRLPNLDGDPLENFTLPPDPGNFRRKQCSPRDSDPDEAPIRIHAVLSKPPQQPVSSRDSETQEGESLTAREKIRNVDLMVRDLQRKSVDKQSLTLDIVRDLQKQLEDIEKSLVTKTKDEISHLPQHISSQPVNQELDPQKDVPVSAKEKPSSGRSSKHLVRTSADKTEVLEKDDVLHDLVPRKSKSKADPVELLTGANVSVPSQSSRSKTGQPLNVASMSMSKRELLDEIRKEKDEHRKQIRHLQSELSRLQHKDPVRKEEVDIKDIHFQEEDLIGEGAFSQVFRGHYQGAEVAVKRLKVPLSSQDKNYFAAEVSLLRDLRHPRVVLLIGVCTSRRLPVMILEYMSKGNLFSLLHNPNRESLDHAEFYQIARDIAAGMVYLHNHRPSVLHLDLKSMNVLIGPMDRAKIADFGFSKLKHDADQKAAKNSKVKAQVQGSPAWMAPELLQAGEVTPKADVYSFAVILWEMLTRQVPYEGSSMFQILEKVRLNKRPEIPSECPSELSEFVSRCWDQNPARRPTFKEVLSTLENLSFPPEWRDLFQQAGVPQEALENVQSTRNIISLVTSTLESSKLTSLLDAAGPSQGLGQEVYALQEESESESTEVEEDLEESSSSLSDDSLESDRKGIYKVSSRTSSVPSHDENLPVSNLNPYSNLHKNFEKLSLKNTAEISVEKSKDKVNLSNDRTQNEHRYAVMRELMGRSTNQDSSLQMEEAKKESKHKITRVPSPESAVSKFSEVPTPRRSREAWSSEDIKVPDPVSDFPHSHIPPPPAPPPPPPPPPPPQTSPPGSNTYVATKSKSGKSTNPNMLVTPQVLEVKSQKLKATKRDRDQRKGNPRPRVTPKPMKSVLFAVGVSDLLQQRSKLKSTVQPHPNQLEDLGQVNGVMLSSIAEILRDAMSERRFAMGEDDPSTSCELEHTHSDVSWSTQED